MQADVRTILARISARFYDRAVAAYTSARHVSALPLLSHVVEDAAFHGRAALHAACGLAESRAAANACTSLSPPVTLSL
jgi:hypothetical protein